MTIVKKNKSVIYQPTGAAAEFCQRAMNLFDGCVHGCLYCYVPLVRHIDSAKFHESVAPRLTLDDIERSAAATRGDTRPVLLCFTSDPYQPVPVEYSHLVREAMIILHKYGHRFTVLTKGGLIAQRDFDLYRQGDSFGVTMTFLDRYKSLKWEPRAAPPEQRLQNLQAAKLGGIDTWVSLEPAIEHKETIAVIHETAGVTDHYKLGKLNYCGRPATNYKNLVQDAIDTAVIKYKRGIQIKSDLSVYCSSPGGYRIGEQLP